MLAPRTNPGVLARILVRHVSTPAVGSHGVAAFALPAKLLVTAAANGAMYLWDLSGAEPALVVSWPEPVKPASLALDPDGNVLAEAFPDGTVRLVRLAGSSRPVEAASWTGPPVTLSFRADHHLAATDGIRVVHLYDVTDPAAPVAKGVEKSDTWTVPAPTGGPAPATRSDGRPVVVTEVGQTGDTMPKVLVTISDNGVVPFAASADGKHAALFGPDGTISLVSPPLVSSGMTIEAKLTELQAVAMAPNGDLYALTDKGLYLWHTDPTVLTDAACRLGPLPEAQWRYYFPGLEYRNPC
ncbi:WD40 repeat domain-containing protein [Kutzneria sp. NPDC052558]|uniref:WD40 repeat domain-containing protein n=1 Tax=Kutzneria sp. NPDC052558 TaxID=3364121 RepID=UPI0037C74C81